MAGGPASFPRPESSSPAKRNASRTWSAWAKRRRSMRLSTTMRARNARRLRARPIRGDPARLARHAVRPDGARQEDRLSLRDRQEADREEGRARPAVAGLLERRAQGD